MSSLPASAPDRRDEVDVTTAPPLPRLPTRSQYHVGNHSGLAGPTTTSSTTTTTTANNQCNHGRNRAENNSNNTNNHSHRSTGTAWQRNPVEYVEPGARAASSYDSPISQTSFQGSASNMSRIPSSTSTERRILQDSELLTRTSWVDARTAYKQVKKGKASGNQCGLWIRWRIQRHLYNLGNFIQRHCGKVLFLGLLLLSLCCVGLKMAALETNMEELWVEEGGRLEKELKYTRQFLGEGSGSTNELLIQTPRNGHNLLTVDSLLLHYQALRAATKVTVEKYQKTWKLKDLCYKTNFPIFSESPGFLDATLNKLVPCMLITPLDCFWEASKLLGPDHGIYVPNYYPSVKWTNLNPRELMHSLHDFGMYFPADLIEEMMDRAGITSGYQKKPCLNPDDIECPATAPNAQTKELPNVGAELTGGCQGFAARFMQWEEDLIIGGVSKNSTGHIVRAEALQSIVLLMGEKDMYEYHKDTNDVNTMDWSQEKAKDILNSWQRKFSKEVNRAMSKVVNSTHVDHVYPFSTASLLDLLQHFSQISVIRVAIGYILMLIYACISMLKWTDAIQSQSGVGIMGVLLVSLSVAAGLGMCSVLDIKFNASTTQIIPFLALGLGVDDMFLIAHTFAELAHRTDIPYMEQTGESLKRVGVSVLLTSLSNAAAFSIAAIIPIPALRAFCIQAAILVLFNLATVLLVFPAVVSFDLIRREEEKVDVFCCFTGSSSSTRVVELQPQRGSSPPPDYYELAHPQPPRTSQPHGGATSPPAYNNYVGPNFSSSASSAASQELPSTHRTVTQTNCDGSHPMTVLAPAEYESCRNVPSNAVCPASSLPPSATSSRQCLAPDESMSCKHRCSQSHRDCCSWSLTRFAKNVLGPVLQKTPAKIFVIVVFTILLILGIVGTVRVKDGLDITDVVPRGTQEYRFLDAQAKYFGFYNFYAVTKEDFDYAHNQQLLHEFHQAFQRVDKIIKRDDGSLPKFWLQLMRNWLAAIQKAFDKDMQSGYISKEGWHSNATDDGILGYRLLIQTGDSSDPFSSERIYTTRLVDNEGNINPEGFYNYLTAWTSNDAMAYAESQANFHPIPKEWYYDRNIGEERKIPKSQPLSLAQLPFYLHNMGDTEQVIATVKEIRGICDDFSAQGLPSYPYGIPFTFWEQYINLRYYLMLSLICVLGSIFLVITCILMNPWAALIVVCVLAMIVVELFGFMGLAGIKLSAIPAVILIISVGIGVEFTVHITLGFLTALGSRNKRMRMTLEHMLAPVVHGAMTTFLGVIMLAGAEFDFIVKYFFMVLTVLVVLGLLNGLILLPVLLSIFGPTSEIVAADMSDRLAPPTPEPSPPPPRRERQVRSISRRVYPRMPSDISLTTITEEPSQYSSQDSHVSVHVEPEVVVSTSLPDGTTSIVTTNSSSNRNMSPPSSGESTPPARHVTRVKATARVMVEVHSQIPGAIAETESDYKSRKRKSQDVECRFVEDSDTYKS